MESRNKVIIILVTLLFLIKLFLVYINFPISYVNEITRVFIFIFSVALFFGLKARKFIKGMFVIAYVLITFLSSSLNLWQVSVRKYITERVQYLDPVLYNLKEMKNCDLTILGNEKLRFHEPCNTTRINWELIHKLKDNSDIIEISLNDEMTLFIFSRFIDNGYGIAYMEAELYPKVLEKNYRINGFEITSARLIFENWYYISFT